MHNGNLVNMTHFTACDINIQVSYKVPKGQYAVFLLLGKSDRKAPELFDGRKALHDLGWVEKVIHPYDESAELADCRANWEKNPNCLFSDMWLGWKACAQSRDESVSYE